MKTIDFDSATNQRIKSKLVEREVHYCVSSLVWELGKQAEHFPEYQDDLIDAFRAPPDYREAISDTVRNWTREECVEYLESLSIECQDDETVETLREAVEENAMDEGPEEFCDDHRIDVDDYESEIFEHWIVSDYFARCLEEKGERVLRDFFGLTIWGRATTGQGIAQDRVVSEIAAGMEILEGQANEWRI